MNVPLSAILAQAKKNEKAASSSNIPSYSTKVKPAKKLPRSNVDPKAIQEFLRKQKEQERKQALKAKKQKEQLLKLRDSSKTTKKANSMAKRTKDNLKVYKGEDLLGLHQEPKKRSRNGLQPELTEDEDKRHKAFMKCISKAKVPGINDDDEDGGYHEPLLERDQKKLRKLAKMREKSRSAANLEYDDLIRLASVKTNAKSSGESSSDEEEDSDDDRDQYGRRLTSEEKYQRERQKRRELEEKLKIASGKIHSNGQGQTKSSSSLTNFKIGKLNSGMSEESKRAKVKALMAKFHKPPNNKINDEKPEASLSKNGKKLSGMHKSSSAPSLHEKGLKRKHKNDCQNKSFQPDKKMKKNSSVTPPVDDFLSSYLKQQQVLSSSSSSHKKERLKAPSRPSSDNEVGRKKLKDVFHESKKTNDISKPIIPKKKTISNPYKHTVVKPKAPNPSESFVNPWAKEKEVKKKKAEPQQRRGGCTLSITSESVKTNYPGVAQEDPYIQAYKKTGRVLQNFTPEMVARYKAQMMRTLQQERSNPREMRDRHRPQPQRHPRRVMDDSDDEYDSELDDFIADDEEVESDVDISSHIKEIFGYDKSKYGRESEYELSKMDASYKDIEKEEKRSLRIAKEEDAKEAKLEEERMSRKMKKR